MLCSCDACSISHGHYIPPETLLVFTPWWWWWQVLALTVISSPPTTFSWEDMQAIGYPPALSSLYEYQHLVGNAYSRLSAEALGGADRQQFEWAMALVHSRAFGCAAEAGGVGVRMLVPLVDMLNHGGDECTGGLLNVSDALATDHVRCGPCGHQALG